MCVLRVLERLGLFAGDTQAFSVALVVNGGSVAKGILIRQQIPNIPWTYCDTIQMPISDHALVLLGIRWRIGAPDPPRRKPQPTVSKWYTTHFERFTNSISTLPVKNTDPRLHTPRRILSAIAHAARP